MTNKIKINDAFIPFLKSTQRYAILLGGAGSGKSKVTVQKIIIRITTEVGHRILCIRKVAKTLRNSVYQDIVDKIVEYGIFNEFQINKSEMRFLHIPTGNEILLAGMDDPEKIKSIAGITSVWCEEATELMEADFNQLELRVRGETANYKQFIVTFNPIDEDHWLKRRFFDVADEQVYTLKTTFLDNAFLDEDYKKHLLERVRINENLYKVYVLGEWGRATRGGEFYKCFLYSQHVGRNEYDDQLPLHVAFDFNVNPYVTCIVFQIQGKKAMQIDEILLSHPRNTTLAACAELERRYYNHRAGMFIYGDPGGLKQSTMDDTFVRVKEQNHSEFNMILNQLKKYHPELRVPRSYPPVKERGNFINQIFATNYEGITILFDERCKKTVEDFSNGKEASDGTKHKEMAKDEVTGIPCQKYHHISDAFDYLITSAFTNEYIKYTKGDADPVISFGARKNKNRW